MSKDKLKNIAMTRFFACYFNFGDSRRIRQFKFTINEL